MIRQASLNDTRDIQALIQSVPGLWHAEWRPDALQQAIHSSGGLAFVWEEGGKILGFSCAHDVGFLSYLSLLVVAQDARGRGIGRALIEHTQHELTARGCAVLISDVWREAAGFYEGLGWAKPAALLLRKMLLGA